MTPPIDHSLLDLYERCGGDPARMASAERPDMERWERVDELLLDLHLIRHGYTDEGYARHVERELQKACADASVVERMHALRL